MNRRTLITVLGTACFLLVSPGISLGFEEAAFQKRMELLESLTEMCEESIETICPDEDGRERLRCLFDHYDETSEDCQSLLDEMRSNRAGMGRRGEMRQKVQEACQDSIETICFEEKGRERVRCLMESYDEASEECQDVLDETMSRRGARGEDTRP